MSPVDATSCDATPRDVTSRDAFSAAVPARPLSHAGSDPSAGYPQPLHEAATSSLQGVTRLLSELANVAQPAAPITVESPDAKYENRLAIVRLGMATSLFSALRAKHPPSASHSLRVALICAAWCDRLQFESAARDRIEVAALLHDVGKIGIPDSILRKPGKLTVEEQLTIGLGPQLACEILRSCCADTGLLDIIQHSTAWFSGRGNQTLHGADLPLGARMLAVADAFDAMTTDHVYRPALSREAAVGQLLHGAGTQFDAELVHDFCRMMHQEPDRIHRQALLRWLKPSIDASPDARWNYCAPLVVDSDPLNHTKKNWRFHDQLLHNMNDGVVYIDSNGIIQHWNYAIERMTGIPADAVVQGGWSPQLLGLQNDSGHVHDGDCPVRRTLSTSSHATGRYTIHRTDGKEIPVRLHVAPVATDQPGLCGVVLIAHDASQQRHLEERVERLHKEATHDPLTQVPNRAAFDQRLQDLVLQHRESGASFSLIICDIDHFKRINDLHGHQAGDEALVKFASILASHSREGDLVGRYGGEEFVLLCPDCDIVAATRRAEVIRKVVEQTPLPSINNQAVTASFGVTEVQAGDSPDSVLARADRALLQAKDKGRNQVIQLGIGGTSENVQAPRRRGFWGWLEQPSESMSLNAEIVTPVPISLAIDKLRGFIADHQAEIVSVNEGKLCLRVNVSFANPGRRSVDASMPFTVNLKLSEGMHLIGAQGRQVSQLRTLVNVELSPQRTRDRRRKETESCANQILLALKGYLMGRV